MRHGSSPKRSTPLRSCPPFMKAPAGGVDTPVPPVHSTGALRHPSRSRPHRALDKVLQRVPRLLADRMTGRGLIGLSYHTVSDTHLPHVKPVYAYKGTQAFERDLEHIASNWNPVDNATIRGARVGNQSLPERALAMTFDDGFRECITVAAPALKRHGIPCTFFIAPDLIDNRSMMFRNAVGLCLNAIDRIATDGIPDYLALFSERLNMPANSRTELRHVLERIDYPHKHLAYEACELLGIDTDAYLKEHQPYLTQEELMKLHNDGFTLGAHTMAHPELWLLDDEAVYEQVVNSARWIQELTGQAHVPFAFPFNGRRVSRALLADIRGRNPFIDLIYDSNDLMEDAPFIINRVDCDSQRGGRYGKSNLPFLIKRAQVLEPLRTMKRSVGALVEA